MIGLCIKYYNHNYGSVLQSLATIQYLKQMGQDFRIIRYIKKKNPKYYFEMSYKVLSNPVFRRDVYELFQKLFARELNKNYKCNDLLRSKLFDDFIEKYFEDKTDYYIGYDSLISDTAKFDIIITGSDQLWSPGGLKSHFYTLEFCSDKTRRVSWASSFGVSEIPQEQIAGTKKFLSEMDYISCREESGVNIVQSLTSKKAFHVCDPVLMFDGDGWSKIVPPNVLYDDDYIFAYFLGANLDHRKCVERFAKETGLKIVTLRHLDQYIPEDEKFGDYAPYDISPEKFVNLIRGAKYVCTDSFHGTCFSIIFQKPFTVFNRYNENAKISRNTRIESLCKKIGVEDRRFCDKALSFEDSIDYGIVNAKLQNWREDSEAYLREALRIK